MRPLDKAMGRYSIRKFKFRDSTFNFDCKFCDEILLEDSFAFGIAREIYIRDCYFKFLPNNTYEKVRTVVDLGANRGAFSALMTTKAKFILSVECGKQYVAIIQHNLDLNEFVNYEIENIFVGDGGSGESDNLSSQHITMNELLDKHKLHSIDLIKMDIEGSEFSLFEKPGWLSRVDALTMEVHPFYGDVNLILNSLKNYNFEYAMADENLNRRTDLSDMSFIYAWKKRVIRS